MHTYIHTYIHAYIHTYLHPKPTYNWGGTTLYQPIAIYRYHQSALDPDPPIFVVPGCIQPHVAHHRSAWSAWSQRCQRCQRRRWRWASWVNWMDSFCGGFLSHGGTSSHHPWLDGIFHEINHPGFLGTPMTPISPLMCHPPVMFGVPWGNHEETTINMNETESNGDGFRMFQVSSCALPSRLNDVGIRLVSSTMGYGITSGGSINGS